MSPILVQPGESIEHAIVRFHKEVVSLGILADMRKHENFIPKGKRRQIQHCYRTRKNKPHADVPMILHTYPKDNPY